MNRRAKVILILLALAAMFAGAQSPTDDRDAGQQTQVRGYWIDPATGLMWAGKDNGKDVNWHRAVKYCNSLRLAGHSGWRLATIEELRGIYDVSSNAPGFGGMHHDELSTFHVKGNLFLTGREWSTSQRIDERGRSIGLAWYFDFHEGRQFDDDADRMTGLNAGYNKRALCVRRSEE